MAAGATEFVEVYAIFHSVRFLGGLDFAGAAMLYALGITRVKDEFPHPTGCDDSHEK